MNLNFTVLSDYLDALPSFEYVDIKLALCTIW